MSGVRGTAAGLGLGLVLLGTTPCGWSAHPPAPTPGTLAPTPTPTPTPGPGPAPAPAPASPAAALQAEAWRLFLEGKEESRRQAVERLALACGQWRQAGDLVALARCHEMQGLILFALARYRESNQAYGEALQIYGQRHQSADQTRLRVSLAMGYLNLAAYDQARALLQQAISAYGRSGDRRGQASALEILAQVEARSGQPQAAVAQLEQAYALTAALGDRAHQADILESMAMVHLPLGHLVEARQALARRRALGPTKASLVDTLLQTLEARSRPEELASPAELEARIRAFRQAGDLTNAASSLEALATVEVNRGQLRQALAHYNEALELYRRQGMRARAAATLVNVGQTLAGLGDYGPSLTALGQALAQARQLGEAPVQTRALLDLADLQLSLGSLELAQTSYDAALTLAEGQQDRFRQAQALVGLADVRRRQQQPQQALALAQRALGLGQAERLPLLEASALATVVRAQESLGQLAPALEAAQQIQTLGQRRGDRWISASGEALAARVQLAQGQPAAAMAGATRAAALFRLQHQDLALAASLNVQARALRVLGRVPAALEAYRQEGEVCGAMGDRRCQADGLYQRSRLAFALGRPEEALALVERSLAITESLRATLPSPDLRQSYFAQVQDHYDWAIELLMDLQRRQSGRGWDGRALELSERARARGLVELLSAARAEVQGGADPVLLQRRRSLEEESRQLLAARLQLRQAPITAQERASRLAALETRLAALQRQQQQLDDDLRRSSPRYADLLLPQWLDRHQIQALLDPDTVLLEYHLGERQSVLWLVGRDRIESHSLPPRAQIEQLVAAFHADLLREGGPPSTTTAALARVLLEPVAPLLAGKRLALVPHGVLHYLPFAALPSPGSTDPLVVHHELVTLPSASTLAALRREGQRPSGPPDSLLVLADPVFGPGDPRLPAGALPAAPGRGEEGPETQWSRLPGTAQEARTIAALPGLARQQRLDLGFAASRQALLAMDLRPYRLVHLATHGKADGLQPERSRLVLSQYGPDGRPRAGSLRLQDIYNLQLAADLVVLSACQSGLGPVVRGEGLVGLTRGFLHAGARRVLASLWNVEDGSTAELMGAFYKGLLQQGLTPAAALRQAQRSLLADPRWHSPYHWAAFTLHGDWR